MSYLKAALNASTQSANVPQTKPIPGRTDMVANNAGGFVFAVDDMTRLRRFLCLGSESGSYYVGQSTLTADNVDSVSKLIHAGRGTDVVDLVVEYSSNGRAAKQDPGILVLAMCARLGDDATRTKAYDAVSTVCRIPTTLFQFLSFSTAIRKPADAAATAATKSAAVKASKNGRVEKAAGAGRGFGKGFRKALAKWYNSKSPRDLAFLCAKYKNRNGWSHTDVLKVAHIKPASASHDKLFRRLVRKDAEEAEAEAAAKTETTAPAAETVAAASVADMDVEWVDVDVKNVTKGVQEIEMSPADADVKSAKAADIEQAAQLHRPKRTPTDSLPMDAAADASMLDLLAALDAVQKTDNVQFVKDAIETHKLSWEHLPNSMLKDTEIWQTLLPTLGLTAMIRNLGRMTSIGTLAPLANATKTVTDTLKDSSKLHKARIHPFNVLVALNQYKTGRGNKGSLSWTPVPQINAALEDAFYESFKAVQPTGLKYLLALDVSGSMGCPVLGSDSISCAMASAAMAMVTARTEDQSHFICFSSSIKTLDINRTDRLDAVMRKTSGINFGATDCAQPMLHAMKHNMDVDVFVVYTDSETYFGGVHPSVAIKQYRTKMGKPNAKLIVVGMAASKFTIADPTDAGMLDIAGFDANAPAIMRDFALGLI
ncbi:trove domain-containing protein [Entophlyctis helioformis]|nr:trove domain-containing protein [Entophlyctis helioformis]